MKFRSILILILLLLKLGIANSQTFYVSPNGSGSSFSSNAPGSLEGARDAIRLVNQNMNADIKVILKDGVYKRSSTFSLLSNDSGTNGYKIIYKAENPRQAFLSGGISISGWTQEGNLWVADVSAGQKFRQLYVNGERGTRSREPNLGYEYKLISWDNVTKTILVNGNEISNWGNLNHVEMVIQKSWNRSHLRINHFTLENDKGIISPMQPERDVEFYFPNPLKAGSQRYYYENAKEFIDEPGEWYHDTSINKIYYLPRSGETQSSEIIVPALETIISADGAANVEFQDLVFEYSNWTRASDVGFVGGQAGYYKENIGGTMTNYIPQSGALQVKSCTNITFSGNLFRNIGAVGLDLAEGNSYIKVRGNVFADIAGNGVTDMSNTIGTANTNDSIVNNYFIRCADLYAGSVPIVTTLSSNIVVEHNEVVQAPYSGISVGWGWTKNTTTLRNSHINYNYVHNFMTLLEDGGGIYTLSNQPNSEIKENFVEGLVISNFTLRNKPVAGIYLDEGSTAFSVANNVLSNIETNPKFPNTIFVSSGAGQNSISGTTTSNSSIEGNAGLQSQYDTIKSWVSPPVKPGPGTTLVKQNIAFGKPTSASQENTTEKSGHCADNNYSTIWESGTPVSDSVWCQVDLYGKYRISLVELAARQDLDHEYARKNFEVWASDKADFSTHKVLAVQGAVAFEDKGKWTSNISDTVSYRYIRVIKTDGTGFNYSELRVEGELTGNVTNNLALNKPTQASGSYSTELGPDKGNDDDITSIWGSGAVSASDTPWWQVDFGAPYILNGIALVTRQDLDQSYARKNIEVRASNSSNFSTYTVLASIDSNGLGYQELWSASIKNSNGFRYVRLVKTDGTAFNFAEFRAFGELLINDETNIVNNKPAQASGVYSPSLGPEKGNDKSNSSIWASGTVSSGMAWWQVDLGAAYILNGIALLARQDIDQDWARKNIEVRASNSADFSIYAVLTKVGETGFAPLGTWFEKISNVNSFRYIRLVKTDGTAFNFAEFRAWGQLTTGISSFHRLSQNLKVYPNPAKDYILIMSGQTIDHVLIYNVYGACLMDRPVDSSHANIDVSSFTSGIYFVRVISDGEQEIVKIIKSN